MDLVTLITTALQIGSQIFTAASGSAGSTAQKYVAAGSQIVQAATGLYDEVKTTLSDDDTATIDAAVEAAHDKCGTDLARVLAELAVAAQK